MTSETLNCHPIDDRGTQRHLKRSKIDQAFWENNRFQVEFIQKGFDEDPKKGLELVWKVIRSWALSSLDSYHMLPDHLEIAKVLANDATLLNRFSEQIAKDPNFSEKAQAFTHLGPVISHHWLMHNRIPQQGTTEPYADYVRRIMNNAASSVPQQRHRRSTPCFPMCAEDHRHGDRLIPCDWPHIISMILGLKLNSKAPRNRHFSDHDQTSIKLATDILWQIWSPEIPKDIYPYRMPWSRVLVRSGFKVLVEENERCFEMDEKPTNMEYLNRLLRIGGWGQVRENRAIFEEPDVIEEDWLEIVDRYHTGSESGIVSEAASVYLMDTYMAGMVRWLHEIGIRTTLSCDGHGQRKPILEMESVDEAHLALWLLSGFGPYFRHSSPSMESHNLPETLLFSTQTHPGAFDPQFDESHCLLDVAEWLHTHLTRHKWLLAQMRDIPNGCSLIT